MILLEFIRIIFVSNILSSTG